MINDASYNKKINIRNINDNNNTIIFPKISLITS